MFSVSISLVFGLDAAKGLFMNCDDMPTSKEKSLMEIFPDQKVDLTLRYREPKSEIETKSNKRQYFL